VSRTYEDYLEEAVGDAESVLDVGCGANSPLGRFKRRPPRTVGVDLHEPSLERSRAAGYHDEYRKLDVMQIAEEFGPDSFDAVVAFDLLEHLSAEDGERLIAAMEQVARRRVVLLTPNGFVPQDEYDDNPLQAHRSGWTPDELKARGFEVRGINGLRVLRGEHGTPRFRPARVWGRIADASEPIAYTRPAAAFHLLAVKTVYASATAGCGTGPPLRREPSSDRTSR
jgi:predicted TPR repeat methyltransferase